MCSLFFYFFGLWKIDWQRKIFHIFWPKIELRPMPLRQCIIQFVASHGEASKACIDRSKGVEYKACPAYSWPQVPIACNALV